MYFQKPFLAVFGKITECYKLQSNSTPFDLSWPRGRGREAVTGRRRTKSVPPFTRLTLSLWPLYVTIWSMFGSIFWKRLVSTNSRLGIQGFWLHTRSVNLWWIWSVDPLLRSCNVNNVCDHNRIVIKYDHEWNRTWQMDYESRSRYDRFILDRCRYPIRSQRFHFWSASDWLALENILFKSSIFNLSFWFSHRRLGLANGRPTRLVNLWTIRLSLIKGEENAPEIEFNHRRSLGYFIMFSINFYICLVVCIHGSTMSNEDIERHGSPRRRSWAKSSSKLLKSAATKINHF